MPAVGHFPQFAAAVDGAGCVVVVAAKRAHGRVSFPAFVAARPTDSVSGRTGRSGARKALDEFCDPLSAFPGGRRDVSTNPFRFAAGLRLRRRPVAGAAVASGRTFQGRGRYPGVPTRSIVEGETMRMIISFTREKLEILRFLRGGPALARGMPRRGDDAAQEVSGIAIAPFRRNRFPEAARAA